MKRLFSIALFCVLFFLSSSSIHAATYYVDPNITDTNVASSTPDYTTYDHTTFSVVGGTDSVYKTIADINLVTLSPGDSVLFRKGGVWREQLMGHNSGTSGNQITYGPFGSGSNPIITGADVMSGFVNGGSNIWDKTGVTTQPLVVVVNGGNPQLMAASRVSLVSTGMWYWTGNTLSVYATSDPSGSVEAGQRASAIDTNGKNYLTFTGLTLKGSNVLYSGSGAGIYAHNQPNTIIVNGCTITQNAGVAVLIGGTSAAFTTQSSTLTYNGENGIYTNNIDNTNQYILDNTIANNGWAAGAQNGYGSGFQGRIKSGEIARNVIYSNGLAGPLGTQHGLYLDAEATGTVSVHDNEMYGQTQGDGVKVRGNATVYRNNIHNNNDGIEVGGNGSSDATYSVYENIVANSAGQGFYEDGKGAGNIYLSAYNNMFYYNGGSGNFAVEVEDNLTSFDFRNNLFSIGNGSGHQWWIKVLLTGTVTIDNNLYYDTTVDANPYESVSTYINLTGWKSLGYDIHSVFSDPLFINPGTDFHLQSASPAINSGANVGVTSDYGGTVIPQGSAPDIGIYEFLVPSSPSSLAQYYSNGTSVIPSGGVVENDSTLIFKFNMSSGNSSDVLTPQVEIQFQNAGFNNTARYSGSSVTYSGTPVSGVVTIPNIPGGTYHWQASVVNSAGQSSWVAMGGNPDISVTYPPVSSSSTSSSSSGCNDTVTSGQPTLFEIHTTKNSATLFFAPPLPPYSNFYISYSKNPNTWDYGTQYNQGFSGGVLSYTINSLQPKTKYYFKIRPGNGCATGNFGNTMISSTTSGNQVGSSYKNTITSVVQQVKNVLTTLLPKKKSNVTTVPTPTSVQATQTPVPVQTNVAPKLKHCILWWCF